ncbi:pentapeptide repeat protein [Clostridium sp. DL-VIII]|uniref:pentapeptide repeat-containing protein n=1 Tax=Clostridium sp. DL-VIII TaxID=641107 RepID=UPI00023B0818|nr:pentapeptide repeat-containing protein [Clostridium sp. DL-VIII]EHJ01110.1 pentapeptide repeat protein [Clostridium sp. DL-VIII]
MTHKSEAIFNKELYEDLKIDCEKCFGFCCIALYFSASEGFPADKDAGKPCSNLKSDFSCAIHKNLRKKGLKGCTAYDCFGAGQKVAQGTYGGRDWKQVPEAAKEMFEVFLIMRQLHEMLWYLSEAFRIQSNDIIQNKLDDLIKEIENVTNQNPDSLMQFDIEAYRDRVNLLLHKTSETVRTKALNGQRSTLRRKKIASRLDCFGADLRKSNLRGADLRGAFLIAADLRGNDLSGADFIGADMRDADLRGTNLEESIFLTQGQINTAKGDSNTKLPPALIRPTYWEE